MKAYEGVFIFPPEAATDARKAQLKNLDDLIVRCKGSIVNKAEWGKRSLGYAVEGFGEGYFVVVDFKMDPSAADTFRKQLQLSEELIKYMVTVKVVEKNPRPATAAVPAAAVSAAPASSAPKAPFKPYSKPAHTAPQA